jgi:broad specificity phosphatase PhoE
VADRSWEAFVRDAWPVELIAVRHGESVVNVAFPAADAAGVEDAGVSGSDAEVPLTEAGRVQARDLGTWLASRSPRPDVVLSSPYVRARQTTDIMLDGLRQLTGRASEVRVDERLRDRELGVLEMQTATAIRRRFPDEAARRHKVGEFLYRPAGGESFPDVALRLRSLLRDISDDHAGRRVLIVGHDAIVLLLRYVIEGIAHTDVLGLGPVWNCSVTRWSGGDAGPRLVEFNAVHHLSPR